MVFKRVKPHIVIDEKQRKYLEKIAKSRTSEKRTVERAKMLLLDASGINVSSIAKQLNMSRRAVYLAINKALTLGIDAALNDALGRGKPRIINDEARSYIIRIACTKPKDLGLNYELWTNRLLTKYIREHAPDQYSLSKISNGTVSKILSKSRIKPHKIKYYMKRTDPNFSEKEVQILHTYKDVQLLKESKMENTMRAILSYDEKPGIQATGNIYPDLSPDEKHPYISRNHDYVRYGTITLLAGIDLVSGAVIHIIREKHRSKEFIEWLKVLDGNYPKNVKITVILDNLKVHTSSETRKYLLTHPERFNFVFTPTHASWLNIIETLFSKMTRSFLRGIRVSSKEELIERMNKYIEDLNSMPTVFVWKYKMDEMPGGISSIY
ncbi:MAG: IS630 family transposase [Thermoplasmata archaeon]